MNKVMKDLKMRMSIEKKAKESAPTKAELKWYGSKEHFNTEKSYEEHLEDLEKKKGTGLNIAKETAMWN